MASFLDLPPEIHQRILSYLLSHRDVAALSAQCRFLHGICEMDLRKQFHEISISADDESIENAFSLLMQILKRPVLGQYVRTIACWETSTSSEYYPMREPQRQLSDREMQLLCAATRKAGFLRKRGDRVVNMILQKTVEKVGESASFEEEILEESRGVFITQALTALLITVSPSLTSLRLTQPFLDWRAFCTTDPRPEEVGYLKPIPDTDYPLASLLHETNLAPEKKPYLHNLCSVSVMPKRVPHYYTMNLNGVLALVNRLPSIETVRAGLLFQQVDWCGPPLEPCKFSRISITDSWLPTFSLASLVVPCETLREFRYTPNGMGMYVVTYRDLNPKTLLKALCLHMETLEILEINAALTNPFEFDDGTEGGRIYFHDSRNPSPTLDRRNSGSLKDFVSLKRLSADMEFLLHFARGFPADAAEQSRWPMLTDCLPGSLEYLCIREYRLGENEDHDIQVDTLMAYFESGLSPLKEIEGVEGQFVEAEVNLDTDEEFDAWDPDEGLEDSDK